MAVELKLTVGSELSDVKDGISRILLFLQDDAAVSGDTAAELRLVFSELLCNAAIHGNHNNLHKNIWVEIRLEDGCVCGSVRDEGDGFDISGIRRAHGKDKINKGRGGRGLMLVCALTDYFDYETPVRRAVFRKRIAPDPKADPNIVLKRDRDV